MAGMEVYGIKVMDSGKQMVEMLGGWVPYDSMNAARRRVVDGIIAAKATPAQAEKFFGKVKMTATLSDVDVEWEVKGDVKAPDPGKGEGGESSDSDGNDEADGDGDSDDDGESESESDGQSDAPEGDEDAPVMHGEFDPWAVQVGKNLKNLEGTVGYVVSTVADMMDKASDLATSLENTSKDVSLLLEASASVQRKIDLIDKKVKEVGSNGNGAGSGGVIVQIELTTPKEVVIKDGLFHNQFPKLAKMVAMGRHTYLPGPPGTGKSHAAKQVADMLGWQFASISLGPTTPESRLMGGMDANGRFHEPPFVEMARWAMNNPENGAVFCLDEMDNGHPGIIATLNSAMANGYFQAPNGDLIQFGRNFVIVGAANTHGTGPTAEFSGRNRLDAATLDRFGYLPWGTDLAVEATLVNSILVETPDLAADWLDVWRSARKNVENHGLKVFVTMRGAVEGAHLLRGGFDIFDAYNIQLGDKLPADQGEKVSPF